MPAASAGSSRQVEVLPLAVTLAVHLLLLLGFILARRAPDSNRSAPRPISVLVRVAPLPPVRPAPVRPPPPQARARDAAASQPIQAPPAAAPPAPEQAIAPAASDVPSIPTPAAEELLARARRQAGAIDRELRGGKPGVPLEADTPWGRFRRAVESAHVDHSRRVTMETYTAPDGVVTYRFRNGGKVYCRRSGGVGPDASWRSEGARLAGAGSAGTATTAGGVDCPTGNAGWERR
jgi:hypothetical protein